MPDEKVRYTIQRRPGAVKVYDVVEAPRPPSAIGAEANWLDEARKWWLAKALAVPGLLLMVFPVLLSASRDTPWELLFAAFCAFLVSVVSFPLLIVAARLRAPGLLRLGFGAAAIFTLLLLLSFIPGVGTESLRLLYAGAVGLLVLGSGGLLVAAQAYTKAASSPWYSWEIWQRSYRRWDTGPLLVLACALGGIVAYQAAGTGDAIRGLHPAWVLQNEVSALKTITGRELDGEDVLNGDTLWVKSALSTRDSLHKADSTVLDRLARDSISRIVADTAFWRSDSLAVATNLAKLAAERRTALLRPIPAVDPRLDSMATELGAQRRVWDRDFVSASDRKPRAATDVERFADEVDQRLARELRASDDAKRRVIGGTMLAQRGRILALEELSGFVKSALADAVDKIRRYAFAALILALGVVGLAFARLEREARAEDTQYAEIRALDAEIVALRERRRDLAGDPNISAARKSTGLKELDGLAATATKQRDTLESQRENGLRERAHARVGVMFGAAILFLFALPLAPRLSPEDIDLSGRYMPFSLRPFFAPAAVPALLGANGWSIGTGTRGASTGGVGGTSSEGLDSALATVAAGLAHDSVRLDQLGDTLRYITEAQLLIADQIDKTIRHRADSLARLTRPANSGGGK